MSSRRLPTATTAAGRIEDALDGLEYRLRILGDSLSQRGVWHTARILRNQLVGKLFGRRSTQSWDPRSHEQIDQSLGIQTADSMDLDALDIASPNAALGLHYQPSPPNGVLRALRELRICFQEFVFVDVGCGKGLVLLLAARRPFRQIIGVDFSPELCRDARLNIERCEDAGQECRDITVVCEDATTWTLPATPIVLYLFNPFLRPVFEKFIAHVINSWEANRQPLYLIYYSGPCHRVIRKTRRFVAVHETFAFTIYRYSASGR